MDKLIWGLLQEEINYIFKDFKQDDLNTNFFKGDLELQNLELNTAAIQDFLATVVPFVQIEKAIVRKLRVKVPFSSPKTKPTEIWISKIDIVAKEPLHYLESLESQSQSAAKPQPPPKPKTGKMNYSLGDRIMDGLKVKIEHIHISFGLLGKFRNAESGLWTPHLADINIFDLDLYSTNEKFQVPAEHADTRAYTHGKPHIWVFKEATCKVSARLVPFRGTKNTQGTSREPISLFEKVPFKAQITVQRLNSDEKIGIQATLFVNQIKFKFSPVQLGYFSQWAEAVGAAAARQDLKPVIQALPKPEELTVLETNLLINLVCDEASVILVEEKSGALIESMSLSLKGFLTNIYSSAVTGSVGARVIFSNIFLKDLKQEKTLMSLYHRDKTPHQIEIPLPKGVLIHPEPTPLPADPHACVKLDVRLPKPAPPATFADIEIKADSIELILDRESGEFVTKFVMQALIVKRDIPAPTLVNYKSPELLEKEKRSVAPGAEEIGEDFFDVHLLTGGETSFSISCGANELKMIFPTPGGGDNPFLEFVCSNPTVSGNPKNSPIAYKRDLLNYKTESGASIVQQTDFFWQKFNGVPLVENTAAKMGGSISRLAINICEKKGAPIEPLVFIDGLTASTKVYSMAKLVPTPAATPQLECNIHVKEVKASLTQTQHIAVLRFLDAHFFSCASSELKSMLEKEVQKLAFEEPVEAKRDLSGRIPLQPTFMIAIVTGTMGVHVYDQAKKPILNLVSKGAEAVIENHPSKGIVFGYLADLRLWVLPELEQSLVWVKKTKLDHVCHTRTEWRTWGKKSPNAENGPSTLHLLADIDGLNVNVNMASIYHCLDYLVSILGETILLAEKTEHSHFFWKIVNYAQILFLTGIQSESFDYWMSLREVKEIADQLNEALLDLFWDVSFSNFNVIFGDEATHVKPFSFKTLQVKSTKSDVRKSWNLLIQSLQGSIAQFQGGQLVKEEPFSVPFDFVVDYVSQKNPEWKAGSGTEIDEYLQNVDIQTKPAVSVFITPEHFRMMAVFIRSHMKAVRETVDRLLEEVNKRPEKKRNFVVDEHVVDEVKGMQQRLNSPNSAFGLKKELDAVQKKLSEQDAVQFDLMTRNAELQMHQADLETKLAAALKEIGNYQVAMEELQSKLIHLQLGSL